MSVVLEDLFSSFVFLPVHPYFYPSTTGFNRPNDGCLHKDMVKTSKQIDYFNRDAKFLFKEDF